MGRKREFAFREYYEFDSVKDESTCLICRKSFKGNYISNLKRHLSQKHREQYESAAERPDADNVVPKRVKLTVEMSVTEVQNACVEMVANESLPLQFFDSHAFKIFTEQVFSGLEIPAVTSRNIQDLVCLKYDSAKQKIKAEVANKILSIKIDTATRHARGILGVNIQFCVGLELKIYTLGLVELGKRHTGENIKEQIEQILKQFGIRIGQIYSVTTDNGTNMIKAVELLNTQDEDDDGTEDMDDEILTNNINIMTITSVKCAAHTLQLAVKDFFAELGCIGIIDGARTLVKTLSTPTYRYSMTTQGLNRPIIDVTTRWNSTYKMLKSLLSYREFCDEHVIPKVNLSAAHWRYIADLVGTLDPIYEATLHLQSSQLFLGDFYIVWMNLKLKVQGSEDENSTLLFKCLEKREERLINSPSVLACVYLDPRIRRLIIKDPIKMMCAKSHLRLLMEQMLKLRSMAAEIKKNDSADKSEIEEDLFPSSGNEIADVSFPDAQSQSSTSMLRKFLSSIDVSASDEKSDEEPQDVQLLAAISEIENYAPKQVDLEVPIMEYWKRKQFTHPYLWSLAQVVHSTPATQVSVERSFSALKLILSDLRCNLSAENLEKILFLKINKIST